jgi:hypothetical protein
LVPLKYGIEQETGAGAEERLEFFLFQLGAKRRRAAVLPDDGGRERLAGGAVPEQGGLALVGEADGGDVVAGEAGVAQREFGRAACGLPQIARVVFDPAGAGKMLREFLLGAGARPAAMVEDDGTRGRGALVERQNEAGHGFKGSPSGAASQAATSVCPPASI